MKKILRAAKIGLVQFGCHMNFFNSIIFKLDKHVVLLLINYVAGYFLACHRREILYIRTVCSWNKNTLQDLKKVYFYGVSQPILYK